MGVPHSGEPVDQFKFRQYTWDEVRKHNTRESCWIVIAGSVYNVTEWLSRHPGGEVVVLSCAGLDCTDIFNAFHSPAIRGRMLLSFKVGIVSDYAVPRVTAEFRTFAESVENSPLMKVSTTFYVKLVVWYSILLGASISSILLFPDNPWMCAVLSGCMMGLYFQQVAFLGHDLGHTAVFHNRIRDTGAGLFFGNIMTGISLGWWKSSHNAHHVTTNSVTADPDIQHLPIFAVSNKFFGSIFSTYHEKTLSFNGFAKFMVPLQSKLYYVAMALARCNLYAQSIIFLLRGDSYVKRRIGTNRRMEILGLTFFAAWYSYLVSCIPCWSWRLIFFLISHCLAGILHVQITLSHFAMPVYLDTHPLESDSFLEHQLKTCLDIDCHTSLDWFHGGLQFQAAHHLFPRIPRCNLRNLRELLRVFCAQHNLDYASADFLQANLRMISHLREVGEECRQAAFSDILNLKG